MTSPDSDAWDGPIDEDENGRNGVDVLLDLSRNTLMVKGILLRIASIDKTWRIKDANLGKWLCMPTTFTNTGTYHDAVLAPNFIKAHRVGLNLITRITLLVCMFENVEVVVVNAISRKDVGDEFQD